MADKQARFEKMTLSRWEALTPGTKTKYAQESAKMIGDPLKKLLGDGIYNHRSRTKHELEAQKNKHQRNGKNSRTADITNSSDEDCSHSDSDEASDNIIHHIRISNDKLLAQIQSNNLEFSKLVESYDEKGKKRIQKLKAKIVDLEDQLSESHQQHAETKDQLSKVQDRLTETETQLSQVQDQLAKLHLSMKSMNQKQTKSQSAHENLREDFERKCIELSKAQQQLEELSGVRQQLDEFIHLAKNDLPAFFTKLQSMK